MLFSENLTLDIDSTKTIQGLLQPELDFKTEKENVLTFKNTANLNLLIERKRIINLINKFEFSSYGKKITVSGGYVHAEYRYLLQHRFEVYPYMESQWAGSRGMTFKLSTGLQARYKFIESKNWLLFANTALFYEFEKWEYPDPPAGTATHAYSRYIKHHLSFSIKCKLGTHWDIITTGIYQARPDSYFKTPRFGLPYYTENWFELCLSPYLRYCSYRAGAQELHHNKCWNEHRFLGEGVIETIFLP